VKVQLNSITNIDDALVTMYFSRGTWNWDLDREVRETVERCTDRHGRYHSSVAADVREKYIKTMATWLKYAPKHSTMASFIGLSFTVEGLHRAGQDDWDAHAKRKRP
jgi:hypothetical protein